MARKLTQLRKIRRLRDFTQEELAAKAGISDAAVYHAENGSHSPRLSTLEAIADALDVEVQDLIAPPSRVSRADGDVSREDGDLTLMRELDPAH